jgi:hypothetical protein
MKMTFSDMVGSDAYKLEASNFTRNIAIVSTITLIYNFVVSDNGTLVQSILIWIAWCVVGSTLLIAMPVYLIYVLLICKMSAHTEYPSAEPTNVVGKSLKITARLWMFFGYVFSVLATNQVVQWVGF